MQWSVLDKQLWHISSKNNFGTFFRFAMFTCIWSNMLYVPKWYDCLLGMLWPILSAEFECFWVWRPKTVEGLNKSLTTTPSKLCLHLHKQETCSVGYISLIPLIHRQSLLPSRISSVFAIRSYERNEPANSLFLLGWMIISTAYGNTSGDDASL